MVDDSGFLYGNTNYYPSTFGILEEFNSSVIMQELCRDRYGAFPATIFKLFSCSMCYSYLFRENPGLAPDKAQPWNLVPTLNGNMYPENFTVLADVTNLTARTLVCQSLSDGDCDRWADCCVAASACCDRQVSQPRVNYSDGAYCPRTWDGYGCFDDALAGTRAYLPCPGYVEHASTSAKAYKDCTENGTWWLDPVTKSEWSNYSTCVPTRDLHTVVHVALACNVVSLALLLPACGIFLGIRQLRSQKRIKPHLCLFLSFIIVYVVAFFSGTSLQLRSQKRIKLHLCLFLSFIIACVVTILWDFVVYMDRLEHPRYETIMHKNSGGCQFLYIMTRYVSTCNFFWMFCEGFYLHRLIVHAFSVPKTLIPYYVFGWVGSWVPAIIYSIIRATNDEFNQSCWVHNIGGYEWILYTPNLLCLALNFAFICNILRILCSKLQANPNEPSNYRKALKATFVLVPLFGLQQFVIIYRPAPDSPLLFPYEIAQNIIINTQGAAVALVFCFMNGEVYGHIKNCVNRLVKSDRSTDYWRKGSTTSGTQFTSMAGSMRRGTRQYDNNSTERGYIPLSTSSTANDVTDSVVSPSNGNGHVTFAL